MNCRGKTGKLGLWQAANRGLQNEHGAIQAGVKPWGGLCGLNGGDQQLVKRWPAKRTHGGFAHGHGQRQQQLALGAEAVHHSGVVAADPIAIFCVYGGTIGAAWQVFHIHPQAAWRPVAGSYVKVMCVNFLN